MLDVLKKLFGLFTLVDNTSPAAQRTWRWMVTFSVLMFTVHVAIACNLLTSAGVHGFAMIDDVEKTRAAIAEVQKQQIESALFETRVRQCQSLKAGQPSQAYAQKIQDLLAKYAELTNRDYQLPQCMDL